MDLAKVGIIGAGGQFKNLHLPNYMIGAMARIVAVADIDERSAKEIAQRCGAAYWFTDYKELLKLEEVEAVDICTPPSSHRDIAVAAVMAGKHVLVEKPMCTSVREADEMIAAADRKGKILQVAYMKRFHPVYLRLKRLLEEKAFGDLHIAYNCQVVYFSPSYRATWLFTKEKSGGMLMEQAIHELDAWLWLHGPVDTVYARVSHIPLGGYYPKPEEAVENNAVLVANFKNGGTGMLLKSWAAQLGHHGEGLIGSEGSARIEGEQLTWKTYDMKDAKTYEPISPDDDNYQRWLSDPEISGVPLNLRRRRYWNSASKGESIKHWLRCIRGEEEPTASGSVGRAGVEIAEAAYRSSLTGQCVKIE